MTNINQNIAIEISGLKKIYNHNKSNAFEALKGINLNIPKNLDGLSLKGQLNGEVTTKKIYAWAT